MGKNIFSEISENENNSDKRTVRRTYRITYSDIKFSKNLLDKPFKV